jgi:hypothetical protein
MSDSPARKRREEPSSGKLHPSKRRKTDQEEPVSKDVALTDASEKVGSSERDFPPVNLLDSDDEDLHNALADDLASDSNPEEDSYSDNSASSDGDESDGQGGRKRKTTTKRNDPSAFATSLSKILATKLPTSKRGDPVLARSADAAARSRALADAQLEAKARRKLKVDKQAAKDRGRVRDVLLPAPAGRELATVGEEDGGRALGVGAELLMVDAETAASVAATERRMRKIAHRGVVRMFNAMRAAQERATEAEKAVRAEGLIGSQRKEKKVLDMSRSGFLDLIASGGSKS